VQGDGAGTATILYTDVVGSTELRVRLGDVEADLLRRRHDDALRATVSRHGGSVVKGLGDGILAAFRASAEAATAAHDIQREIDRMNRQARDDQRIGVRIGISAGDVSWEDGDCHGTPVVTAARLCDAAEGGQILCDDLVRGLVRGHTELSFTLVGELTLKGLPEPVVTYELPWSAAMAATSPLPAPLRHQAGELPFAAREQERVRLAEAWKRAQVERATTVLLAGEPGIGKTRIASEVARQAHDEGAMVVLGRCDEHLAAAHAPWTELLRQVVSNSGDEVIVEHVARHGGEITRLVPDLARRAPDAPPPAQTDPDTERLLLFEAVVHLLAAAAVNDPLVIILDDAHWADTGSVHLLRHVVGHIDPDTHLLLVVTYRDTDVDRGHPLSAALADLHRTAGTERIALRGLDEAGMRAFLEAAGGHPLADEGLVLAQRLAVETDGNPFFVTEVLRHLVETGAIVQHDGQWVGTTDTGQAGLPEGVRDVVGQRLSRLSLEANDLLRTAAVVGREFTVDVVAAVNGVDDEAAGDALDEAVAARLVDEVEGSPGRLSFSHALVRQTLLEELTTNKRLRLHRRIAELLDQQRGTPIEQLAYHYLEAAVAGVAPRAIECACEAARGAVSRMAWEDALDLYERALEVVDLLDDDDPGTRADILSAMAHAHHGLGESDAARARALTAAELARGVNEPARLAEAGIAYQGDLGVWARPSDPIGVEIVREGLDALGPDRPDIRARGLASLAHALILAPGGALAEADEAVEAARSAGDERVLSDALVVRAWAVRGTLPVDQRLRAAEGAVAFAVDHNYRQNELSACYQLGNAQLQMGDLAGAAETFARGSDFRGAMEGWSVADFQASLAIAEGRFAEAEALSDRAHSLGEALGDTNDFVHAYQHWTLAIAVGDVAEAQVWHERGAATVAGSVVPSAPITALAAGDDAQARRLLAAWIDEIQPLLPGIMRYVMPHHLSMLALQLATVAGLDDLIKDADRSAGELLGSDAGILGAADAARGRFAAVRDDLDTAVALLEAGHALHLRLELHQLIVESGLDLGRILLRRNGPRDQEVAQHVLGETAQTAERIGMAPALRDARALLA
jgi:class 3 adenylate cyclase/tetratricopeptide (TPR) repeat protein